MKTHKEMTQELQKEFKDIPSGFDNTRLIEHLLFQWETEIRMDQLDKDHEMFQQTLRNSASTDNFNRGEAFSKKFEK